MNGIDLLIEPIRKATHIYLIGDGGSAALADHFACDLLKNCKLPAISLCSNASLITAIANDYSFDQVYSMQLGVLWQSGDLLIVFSTSGNSPNLFEAIRQVKNSILIAGNKGGICRASCNLYYDIAGKDQMQIEDDMLKVCHKLVRRLDE